MKVRIFFTLFIIGTVIGCSIAQSSLMNEEAKAVRNPLLSNLIISQKTLDEKYFEDFKKPEFQPSETFPKMGLWLPAFNEDGLDTITLAFALREKGPNPQSFDNNFVRFYKDSNSWKTFNGEETELFNIGLLSSWKNKDKVEVIYDISAMDGLPYSFTGPISNKLTNPFAGLIFIKVDPSQLTWLSIDRKERADRVWSLGLRVTRANKRQESFAFDSKTLKSFVMLIDKASLETTKFETVMQYGDAEGKSKFEIEELKITED